MSSWGGRTAAALWALALFAGCGTTYETRTLAGGLNHPSATLFLAEYEVLLVAEAGSGADSDDSSLSAVETDGSSQTLVVGLPSTTGAGSLLGTFLLEVSADRSTLFLGAYGGAVHRLEVNDLLEALREGYVIDIGRFPAAEGEEGLFINPYDLVAMEDGSVLVADASRNELIVITSAGRSTTLPIESLSDGDYLVEPVPTGMATARDSVFVTLTTGCPFLVGLGQVVTFTNHVETGRIDGFTLPLDVIALEDGDLLVLEFAQPDPTAGCYEGDSYRPDTGRILRVEENGQTSVVVSELNYPSSMTLVGDELYVTEIFDGSILAIPFSP